MEGGRTKGARSGKLSDPTLRFEGEKIREVTVHDNNALVIDGKLTGQHPEILKALGIPEIRKRSYFSTSADKFRRRGVNVVVFPEVDKPVRKF